MASSTGRTRSTFPYQVKRWRAYLGVTQRRFAELWGVSASLVQKIEADDYSVSQLSFERLETLRALLELPSATFYGLLATHPDPLPDETETLSVDEAVAVRRLEAGLAPVNLPRTLLGDAPSAYLAAFTVAPTDFAPDRVRYRLRVGALVVIDTSGNVSSRVSSRVSGSASSRVSKNSPRTVPGLERAGALSVVQVRYEGRECRALIPPDPEPPFLRPFDPESDAALEPEFREPEPLGQVVGYWVGTA